jgi:hypothetical protein
MNNNNIYQKLIRELDDLTMELKVLRCNIEHLHEFSKKQHNEKQRYEKGFNLLMDYWESLPDDEKNKIDKELQELSL